MQKYFRYDREVRIDGSEIKLIKEELARDFKLQACEIVLIHNNLILKESEMIGHYNISVDDGIWFGSLSEYSEEFGCHIAVEIKSGFDPDAINVTEMVLVKPQDTIATIRNWLVRLYPGIVLIYFFNYQRKKLLDSERVEDCGLLEYPVIFTEMHKYFGYNQEVVMHGVKIKVIKKELADKFGLQVSDRVLIHNNLILEDYQTIKHYEIPFDERIWFGRLSEYLDEFGNHVAVVIKASYNPDAIALTERVLVKPDETILNIRRSLVRIYPWAEKVNLFNHEKMQLSDHEKIEDCGLKEHPVIYTKTPKLVSVEQSKKESQEVKSVDELDKVFTDDTAMHGGNTLSFMKSLIELTRTHLDARCPDGMSNMSKFMSYANKTPEEVQAENPDFNSLITGMFSELDITSRQDASMQGISTPVASVQGASTPGASVQGAYTPGAPTPSPSVQGASAPDIPTQDTVARLNDIFDGIADFPNGTRGDLTLPEAFQSGQEIFNKCAKLREKSGAEDFNPVEHKLVCNVMNILFQQLQNLEYGNDDYINRNMVESINNFLDDTLKKDGPVDVNEIGKAMLEIPKGFGIDTENQIATVSVAVKTFNEMFCPNVQVIPNIDNDDPLHITSAQHVTPSQVKDIMKEENKDIHLVSLKSEQFYKDEDVLPASEPIYSITVSKLDDLEIELDLLADGGFGSVYKCKNKTTGRVSILKQLLIEEGKNLEDVKEVLGEIFASFKIAPHNRLIQYYGYYVEDNCFYIEMEFMEGGSLRDYVDKNGVLSLADIRHFTRQILEGLQYLHAKQIQHGDIKPDNVLLDGKRDVKLCDYGWAKCFHGTLEEFIKGKSRSRQGIGRYQAPEMQGGGEYGAPADVWAFGITVIEMIIIIDSSNCDNVQAMKAGVETRFKNSSLIPFIDCCLAQDSDKRWTPSQLLESEFFQ